jgi:ABC-type antimicrobial peptide transport system permease subunit
VLKQHIAKLSHSPRNKPGDESAALDSNPAPRIEPGDAPDSETQAQASIPLSTLSFRDLLHEVRLDIISRPGRNALTALGTMVGIAVLVTTLGLSASLNAQLEARFDALTPTEITVTSTPDSYGPGDNLPADAPNRALRINGTLAATTLTEIDSTNIKTLTGTPGYNPTAANNNQLAVYAASSGIGQVIGATIKGTIFSDWHDATGQPVAVLGRLAAEQLGITNLALAPVVFINSAPLVVVGIIDQVQRNPSLLQAIIVPHGYATAHLGVKHIEKLLVETVPNGADIVGNQLGLAIRPDNPDLLNITIAPTAEQTRALITSDSQTLFIILGIISLIIGAIGIANVTLVSVMERVPEIGLRRAIGARRRHILAQFLTTSLTLGFIGGILGTETGAIITVTAALTQNWPPTMPTWVLACSPLIGALVGLTAGLPPAIKASRIQPTEALRA